MHRRATNFVSGLLVGLVLMFIGFSYMSTSETRQSLLRRQLRYDTATYPVVNAAPPDKPLLTQEDLERIQDIIKPIQFKDKDHHHGKTLYTCVSCAEPGGGGGGRGFGPHPPPLKNHKI